MAILDQYGKEIKHNKPIIDEIAVQSIRDRYSSYPANGLTPERLAAILREADQGDVFRQAELFEEMEEKDCHLGSVLGTRKLAVSGLKWEVLPASESAEDKKIAAAAKEMLDYIENLRDCLFDILDGVGKGFSVSEVMWEIVGSQVWIREILWIHQKKFTFYSPEKLLRTPRLITDAEPVHGEELIPNKFVFHRHRARSGATPRGGLIRPCTYMYLFKNFDIKDWVIFNELYAVPMRIGKYKPGTSEPEKDALKRAVFNLGVDAAAVVSDTTLIELLEAKNRGDAAAFQALADFCERSMSKVILGHTGSVESTAGKLGNEDQAKEVRQDLLEADGEALENTVKFQILKPWVAFNFGPDKGLPLFKLHYEAPEDLESAAKVYGILVKDVGFGGIPVDHIHDRFSIPKAKQGEETVKPPAATPATPQPADPAMEVQKNKAGLPVAFPDQTAVDALGSMVTPEMMQGQMEAVLASVVRRLQASGNPDEAMAALIAAFPEMDTTALDQVLGNLMFITDLIGRLSANEEG
jgi:phage gp29-like protein